MVPAVALRTLARRQRALTARSHNGRVGNCGEAAALLWCFLREETMRWKISRHGHDPRQVDLLAVIALVIIIAAVWSYLGRSAKPPDAAAFVEPSQSVRW